ncbi:uncharacterized protein LOC126696657 [Quercus robur]|uniref:uncharacterized protein LOC126696657 n=1 Tax=Quercus robur TaxID=38942 RepID=UPI00216132D6|nr:uncharacterized protein LOC126696657 [Quercus robur]
MYQVDDGGLDGKFLLATRFFTGRALNMEAIAQTFKLLWHTKKGFEVRNMGSHRVLFLFLEESDIDRVVAGEPWSFNKYLVHDLPVGNLNMRVIQEIVSVAGEFVHNRAEHEDYEGGNFMRVRMKVDVTKPLSKGRKIGLCNESEAQQTGAVLHAGLEDAVSDERSTSVCRISAQVGGFVSQDFQAKLDEIDVDLRCFETSKVVGVDEWDMRAVPSNDRGGGLALLWKKEVDVWVDSFLNYHIDSIVHGGSENAWRLTGFYGKLDTNRRSEGWNMLRMLSSKDFRDWILLGMGGKGENGFGKGKVRHLNCFTSDHRPILLYLDGNGEQQKWHKKPFRFESMWISNPECKEVKEKLWHAEEVSARSGDHEEVIRLKKELNVLHDKEEKMWQQRSRVQWLKNGDQNTKFFHRTATQRKRKNFIKGLRDGNGVWQEDEVVFSTLLNDFYTNLFTSSNPQDLDHVLDRAVLSCLNSRSILRSINHTFITLIPKVHNLKRVSDFHPVSFCTVIYKIISKAIANCLKPMLNSIISEIHSAFIADRLITNNILIDFESLHHMKNSYSGKKGFMAMKLDMSKAYDRVEWVFLEKILLKTGFSDTWVALIMECITTVSYSILVNGEPNGVIVPSRGLRQGDPLSPYLFLFCAEGLNALLRNAADEGVINGFSLCRNGSKLTHMFFADDCLIFCRSTLEECNKIQELFTIYETASGQMINKEKTNLFFSKNTDEATQEAPKVALSVSVIKHYEKYLGLPSFVGRDRKACST